MGAAVHTLLVSVYNRNQLTPQPPNSMVREIENLAEFNSALSDAGDKLVVVDFTATWCGPCKNIAPKYQGLSEDPANQNVIFLKVDVDEAEDVAQQCKITCMPTFHFYRNGEKVEEIVGANFPKLEQMVTSLRS